MTLVKCCLPSGVDTHCSCSVLQASLSFYFTFSCVLTKDYKTTVRKVSIHINSTQCWFASWACINRSGPELIKNKLKSVVQIPPIGSKVLIL